MATYSQSIISPLLSILPQPVHVVRPVRRRPTRGQGEALETLGHAVEYLLDSRFGPAEPRPGEREAIQVLKRASRDVFYECAIVVSWADRLRSWIDAEPA